MCAAGFRRNGFQIGVLVAFQATLRACAAFCFVSRGAAVRSESLASVWIADLSTEQGRSSLRSIMFSCSVHNNSIETHQNVVQAVEMKWSEA